MPPNDVFQVQNIRAMFQEQHARLGGSLQNISTIKTMENKPERPKSALGNQKDEQYRCNTPEQTSAVHVTSGRYTYMHI